MLTLHKIVITLGLAALLASPALAQRGGGGRGMTLGQILNNASVQKELKFEKDESDKVKAAVKKVDEDNKDDVAKLQDRNTSREDKADITKKLNDAYDKAVADILTADQKKRLQQIQLQQAGLQAFANPDVVKTLSLTDDAKTKLKDLSDDLAKQMQDLRGGGGGRGNFQKMQELRKDFMDKALNVLTDDQKKAWKDLTGEPFQLQFQGGGGTPPTRTREA
jgi:hypothetical protein